MNLSRAIRNNWFKVLTLIAIIVLLWRGCSIPNFFGTGQTIIQRDTTEILIPGKDSIIYDTIPEIVYRNRDFHHYHTDTIWNKDTTDWSVGYIYEKKDSIIDAQIGIWTKERPDSISFNYKIFIPTVYKVDTLERIITNTVRTTQLYLGPEAVVYPGFRGGFVSADLISSKGWQVEAGIGYGEFNDGTQLMGKVGFKKVISFRKKK